MMQYLIRTMCDVRRATFLGHVRCMYMLFIVCLGVQAGAFGQPVHPALSPERPAQGVYTLLAPLQNQEVPRIGLYDAERTASRSDAARRVVDATVTQWEWLLMGLNLPYRMVTDKHLSKGIPDDIDVLILPIADELSGKQQKTLRRFITYGGGLLAAGPVGAYEDDDQHTDTDFFNDLFSATYAPDLPNASGGLLQTLPGGHPLTRGLPMGYRLNVTTADTIGGAFALTSTGIGEFQRYQNASDERDLPEDLTLLLYGEREQGRYAWFGFTPPQVSEKPDQQAVYQGLVINALAYVAQVPAVAVRPWPNGHQSATVFAGFPLVGTDYRYGLSMTHMLDVMEAEAFPATFFLTSDEARLFPGLLKRLHQHGEAALSADTDALLYGQPLTEQRQRLDRGRMDIQTPAQPIRGLFPPASLLDEYTVQAMQESRFTYILESPPLTSAAPLLYPVSTNNRIQRGYLAAATGRTPTMGRPADHRLALPITGRDDYALLNQSNHPNPTADLYTAYEADFNQLHAMQGLYVLPFHPEIQALTPVRARVLEQVAAHARKNNSWVATAGEVADWWRQRTQVEVQITERQDTHLTLRITNHGAAPIEGLGLDLYTQETLTRIATTRGDVMRQHTPDPNVIYLAMPPAFPGHTLLTVYFDTTRQ